MTVHLVFISHAGPYGEQYVGACKTEAGALRCAQVTAACQSPRDYLILQKDEWGDVLFGDVNGRHVFVTRDFCLDC